MNSDYVDWRQTKHSFETLRRAAYELEGKVEYQMEFLKRLGVVPEGAEVREGPVPVSLPPGGIKGVYLARMAVEWDAIGPASPVDWVNSIEYDIQGTRHHRNLTEMLVELGQMAQHEEERCRVAA